MPRVWRRIGLTGGIGGALSIPFWRFASGGRLIVVILEVDETNLGSDMSDLLTYLLRCPWGWKPCVVGVVADEATGDG